MSQLKLIYQHILNAYEAEEMAEDNNCSVEEVLCQWIDNVGYEGEFTEEEMPRYHRYICKTNEGFDVYYDYGADYYFFVDDRNLHENKCKKIRLSESMLKKIISESISKILNEINNNPKYTHYAVNRATNKIINGWEYGGYDTKELKSDMKYYFYDDLSDNGFNPKDYKILSLKFLLKNGIDPNNDENWANS